MTQLAKTYTVKEWFANKIANEIQRNISMCEVFAVLKETDKAVYAMLNLGYKHKKTMWVPKSVLEERNASTESEGVFIDCTYEEASREFDYAEID